MEEENAIRFQHAELGVSCLANQLPLPVRLEAAHHEAEMYCRRKSGQAAVICGVPTDKGQPATSIKMFGVDAILRALAM
jgi:hypothetical protein